MLPLFKFIQAIPLFLFFGILWLLPVEAASWLIGRLVRWVGPWLPAHRIGQVNIRRAFPEWTTAQQETALRDAWENIGRTVGEMAHLKEIVHDPSRITCSNVEDISERSSRNKPVIYAAAHLANWELQSLYVLHQGVPLAVVARHPNNMWIARFVTYLRRRCAPIEIIYKGSTATKPLLKKLREGGSVGVLLDQKLNQGLTVPFFGHPAKTATAFVMLAKRFDADFVPFQIIRKPGVRFEMRAYASIDVAHLSEFEALTCLNQHFESWIRENPGQWLWFHRRWPREDYTS